MEKMPIREQVLVQGASIIAQRVVQTEGSVDEGVQSAPVAVDCDTRLKKIYVYTDNVFSPQSLADSRTIRVQTDAYLRTSTSARAPARPVSGYGRC